MYVPGFSVTWLLPFVSIPPPPLNQQPGPPKITWQRTSGNLVASSQLGTQNGTPALPTGLTLALSHPVLINDDPMEPTEIVSLLLDGMRKR